MATAKVKLLEAKEKLLEAKEKTLLSLISQVYELSKKYNDNAECRSQFKIKSLGISDTVKEHAITLDELNMAKLEAHPELVVSFKSLELVREMMAQIMFVHAKLDDAHKKEEKSGNGTNKVRLPPIELIKFNGNINDWIKFSTNFKRVVIDNYELNNDEKTHYLTTCLVNQPARWLDNILPSGINFKTIWEKLTEKYSDPRMVASAYVNRLLNFKPITTPDVNSLTHFIEIFESSVLSLKQTNVPDVLDYVLLHLAMSKMDIGTVRAFETSLGAKAATFETFAKFIQSQCKILTRLNCNQMKNVQLEKSKPAARSLVVHEASAITCALCKGKHSLYRCNDYLEKDLAERWHLIKKLKLCSNCLGKHDIRNCSSKFTCRCGKRHNNTLHNGQIVTKSINIATSASPEVSGTGERDREAVSLRSDARERDSRTALLPTLIVNVKSDYTQRCTSIRCLTDSGSTHTFVSTAVCNRLKLKLYPRQSQASGLGDEKVKIVGYVWLNLFSRIDPRVKLRVRAEVLKRLTSLLPREDVNLSGVAVPEGVGLADENFHKPGAIECILSADILAKILTGGKRRLGNSQLYLFNSSFGKIVMGDYAARQRAPLALCAVSQSDDALNNELQRFWKLEEVEARNHLSPAEKACDINFEKTVRRLANGAFSVSLPFSESPDRLGDSRKMAETRLKSLERKLAISSDLRESYNATFQSYIDKKFIVKIKDENQINDSYYIPHRPVVNPAKKSSPVRIVLDASSKSSTGKSLNDISHAGPNIQSSIFNLLINFRLVAVGISSDVRQMYFSIGVNEEHRRFLRVLYRFSTEDRVSTYEFQVLPLGLACSSFLAVRSLRKVFSDDECTELREVLERSTCTYMDDYLLSVKSPEEAIALRKQLIESHDRAGFKLTKWLSNSKEFMAQLPEGEESSELLTLNSEPFAKVIGLWWNPARDVFSFKSKEPAAAKKCTKRIILSVTASLYDPLGFLTPVTAGLKILIQECWKGNLGWDTAVPTSIEKRWKAAREEFGLLSQLGIPRHLGVENDKELTLVGFADASEACYGAVIYARIGELSAEASAVNFICAKSRITPLKKVSLARLELCAAHLLAKLYVAVKGEISERCKIDHTIACSDSTVTLAWIKSSPHRWHTFVANRTAEIREMLSAEKWFHVPGTENPCDVVTRPVSPSGLIKSQTWFEGPSWVKSPLENWPLKAMKLDSDGELPEAKPIILAASLNTSSTHFMDELAARVSSWNKLINVMVLVLRFVKIVKSKGYFSVTDREVAENVIIKHVQKSCFASELEAMRRGKKLGFRFRKLTPFIHEGIIRVGGRLRHSDLTFSQKHPALLPAKHNIVKKLIIHMHESNFHAGPELLLALLRANYWVMAARNVVRACIHSCNVCFKLKPRAREPLMGDLPEKRVKLAHCFEHVGTDYFGPVVIKMNATRHVKTSKAYVCLFMCLATKAIHLELVSDLTTALFLAAFKRLISRRGPVTSILSDGGRNFVGAKRLLNDLYDLVGSENFEKDVRKELTPLRIEFKINPPLSPHHGGLWESNVKCVKSHLYRVLGNQVLNYEEFNTLLVQIEAILNSRPLCILSQDPNEIDYLSPAHFLTLRPLKYLPAQQMSEVPLNRVHRSLLVDHMVQSYWKRWQTEYLSTLQAREKWNTPDKPITVGQVVVLKEPGSPPLHWPLGRIEEVIPGPDGVVRVVRVKTKTGVYTRSATRICPLPSQ